MPRIISVIAQKGGVGKTTATVHFATALANMGFKTLVLDWDTTQGNLTYATIGELDPKTQKGICHIIASGGNLDEVIYPTKNPNLSVIPTEKMNARGNAYSIGTILTQLGAEGYSLLRELINESDKLKDYHFILIDNCPNLGMETVASLIASDYFLVPVQMKDFSITSIGQTFKTAMTVKKAYNPNLEALGLFVSSTDNRIKQAKVALEELKEFCIETAIPLLKVTIPSVSKFDFLPRNQQTIFDVAKAKDRGHKEYLELTKEILSKMKSIEAAHVNKNSHKEAGV